MSPPPAPGEDGVDCGAVVVHVQPLPPVLRAGVQREGLVVERQGAEVRDQLLRELIGPVVVGAVGDGDGQPVGLGIGPHRMIGPGLRRVVGRARPVGGVLVEDLVGIERQVPVDLARRDVVEARHLRLPCRLEHGLGPENVRAEEQPGVEHGQRVVRLGGEVDDRVDPLAPQGLLGGRGVTDVSLDEDDPVLDVGQAGSVAGVGEDVVHDHMVLGVLFHPVAGEVRPDETGTSRDEKAHSGRDISPGPAHHHCPGGAADGPRRRRSLPGFPRVSPPPDGRRRRWSWPGPPAAPRPASPAPPGPGCCSGRATRRPGCGAPPPARGGRTAAPGRRAGGRGGSGGPPAAPCRLRRPGRCPRLPRDRARPR